MTQFNKNKKLIIIGSTFVVIVIICVSVIVTTFKGKNTTVVNVLSASDSINIKESISPELKSHKDLPSLEDIKPEVSVAKKDDASIKETVPDSSKPIIISNENKKSSEASVLKGDELNFASISDSKLKESDGEILEHNLKATNEIKSKENKKNEKALTHTLPVQIENVNDSLEKLESQIIVKEEPAQSALPEPIKTADIHKLNHEDENSDKQSAQEKQKLPQTVTTESEKNTSITKDQNYLEVVEEKKEPQNEVKPQILAESLSDQLEEPKKDETQSDIAKADIPAEVVASQPTQEIPSLDTDSVNNNNSNSLIIKSIHHFDCGNNNHGKICGSFEIHNLPTPLNEFPTMKVFFAVKTIKLIQDIASEISDYDTQEPFDSSSISEHSTQKPFDPSSISEFISDTNGTTFYNSKDQDKTLEVDNLTLKIILDQIENSDFITFFNSLKIENRNKWDEKNLFVIIPGNLGSLEKYSLTGKNWITKEQLQLSNSGSTKAKIKTLEAVDFKKEGGYFFKSTSNYKLNTKIITNLFGQEGLAALSVEFNNTKTNETTTDSQFNSLDEYNLLHPNNRRITFSDLNIMHHYEYDDRDIISVLENIKAKGLINEINEQMKQQIVKPFSILLIGSEDKFNEFIKDLPKKNN